MAFPIITHFDKDGVLVTPRDVENRTEWYKAGQSREVAFVEKYRDVLNVAVNPEKTRDKTSLDIILDGRACELKSQETPFFKARELYNLDPSTSITFNVKDAINYSTRRKYSQRTRIIYWVNWIALSMTVSGTVNSKEYSVEPVYGVWSISLRRLITICKAAPIHWYGRRGKTPVTDREMRKELIAFEPRLRIDGITYSPRSRGANSACSYVLSLRNFDRLV